MTTYDSITKLSAKDQIRLRPEMSTGDVNDPGYHGAMIHLIRELVGNSVDEFLGGHATEILITLDPETNRVSVKEDGRGIPLTPHETEAPLTNFEVAISHISHSATLLS